MGILGKLVSKTAGKVAGFVALDHANKKLQENFDAKTAPEIDHKKIIIKCYAEKRKFHVYDDQMQLLFDITQSFSRKRLTIYDVQGKHLGEITKDWSMFDPNTHFSFQCEKTHGSISSIESYSLKEAKYTCTYKNWKIHQTLSNITIDRPKKDPIVSQYSIAPFDDQASHFHVINLPDLDDRTAAIAVVLALSECSRD